MSLWKAVFISYLWEFISESCMSDALKGPNVLGAGLYFTVILKLTLSLEEY